MMFSVNQLWERCVVPVPELSISLPAPVYGKRELFLSLSGEPETIGFLVVPHIPIDWTITVWAMCSASDKFRPGVVETNRHMPRRPVRTNMFVSRCPLRL